MFPFLQNKTSISSLGSTTSLRPSRPSDSFSVESGSTYTGEAYLRPTDTRKPKTSAVGVLTNIIRKRSRSKLRAAGLRVNPTSSDIPPLPQHSPDYIPFHQAPPSPPPTSQAASMSKKDRSRIRKKPSTAPPPPPIPPKDSREPEIALDTDLDRMEGIVDLTILPQQNMSTDTSSPNSMFGSSDHSTGISSDVSSSFGHTPQPTPGPSQQPALLFNNPFQPPSNSNPKRKLGPSAIFERKISPKTRPSIQQNIPLQEVVPPDADSPSWTPPESWAVEKEGEDPTGGAAYSSSDDSVTLRTPHSTRKKRRRTTIARELKAKGSGSHLFKIRIYRANNTYHVVSIDLSVTVAELSPVLNKKLLLDPEAEVHRLYLKERGRERILAQTERPADIVRRRLDQAGYDIADGLDLLGADDIQFLMKFVYKSNVLGPAEEELTFDNYEYIDLTGRSLKTVPVPLYPRAETIISLNLSRNPMLEIPLDFIQSCTTLRELRLSNMAMKKVPQSIRHCTSLIWLDLSCNRIGDLDDAGLDGIPGLGSLKIQNNRIEKLPWYLPRLHHLKVLNISNNKFKRLPDVILKVASLTDLDVSFNMIQDLPEEIGNLKQLERLILVGNSVSRFPHGCSSLESLEELDCRRNMVSDLSVMCMLPRVKSILADHNAMLALDLSFGPSLTHLDASHNDITQLTLPPGPVGQPFALTYLDISYTKLSSLDEQALAHLSSLRTLLIDHNAIRTLPDSLGELAQLRHLSVSNNQLYTLPFSIGRLQKLEKLEAHNNSLSELPASLWDCASLTLINMTSNLLGSFHGPEYPSTSQSAGSPPAEPSPLSLGRPVEHTERKISSASTTSPARPLPPLASSLERLYLGENRLTEDVLHPLTLLKELKVLNLSFNDIQEIPPTFFKSHTHLEELYLSGNKLSSLPSEDLHSLSNLRVLFLNGNKLQTLPREMGSLMSLSVLDVGSNNLKYNINNLDYDWNWNFNPKLRYLNLSGNKRLEIKPPSQQIQSQLARHPSDRKVLDDPSDFSNLKNLKVLGLMDVTTMLLNNIPDDNEDRRVRTSLSEINKMAYGIADTLGGNLNMFDFVQPSFRGREDEAIFAMFGRSSHVASHNRVSKYLHDHFVNVFSKELEDVQADRGETVQDALRRSFLKLNKYLHDFLYERDTRKPSTVSASGSIRHVIDMSCVRSGASGVVLYFSGRMVYVANAGNSLAVVSRQGTAELLSRKHDPFNRSETARIRSAEGWVSPKGFVNDEIDISRSFGFFHLLPVINARPDIFPWLLSELDEFIIVANQGLWDYVPYQTAVDIARSEADPMMAAQKLRDFAISYGAEGTTMIMVISVADLFPHGRSRQPTVDTLDPEQYVTATRRQRGGKVDNIKDRDVSRLDDEVSPPTGHVAIVFTDIRNSTHLWEVNAGMNTAIQQHNLLLRRQLRFCGGYEVKTEGDSFMCSFPTTMAALWWCLTVQNELLKVEWPLEILECEDGKPIHDSQKRLVARGLSVRMGIHHGKPVCDLDPTTHRMDYLGPMVNRAARINSCAAGGQIMCSSEVMREINAKVFDLEPETEHSHYQPAHAVEAIRRMGVVAVPHGEVKLKGLEIPEMLTAVYPQALIGRKELETADPGAAGSRIQFSPEQMRELAVLCVRLEALTSSRVFRPLPRRKGSTAAASQLLEEEEKLDEAGSVYLYGNVDALIPPMDKLSDADLMLLLDSLSLRIENSLAALTLNQIKMMNRSSDEVGLSRRNGGAMDVRMLQQLLSLLQS
ncbi:cysteinyl-tRNA synthetase [Steccherinum ochraceum]|uniref:Adenylate cyclase n=1 Tax=Steccherinum ochraceum TaxID=92696 RepID=A0A4R0RK78_9APHY|nr:cysteinyl-tRNA synthetase [Steccherinum ochraceum]